MKKRILTLTIMQLMSLSCINIFASMPDNDETVSTSEPHIPTHKSIYRPYIIDSFDNEIYTLFFNKTSSNAEIKIYKNGILVEYYRGSFNEEQAYTTNLKEYGTGVYTIEVYNNGNKIFYGSEEI